MICSFGKRRYFFNKTGSFLQLFGRQHTAETNFILKYNFSVYDQLNGFINVGRKHLQRLSREKCSLLVLLLVRLIFYIVPVFPFVTAFKWFWNTWRMWSWKWFLKHACKCLIICGSIFPITIVYFAVGFVFNLFESTF